MRLFASASATRRWLKLGLTIGGGLAGALFGVVITRLGKIVAGAPPATLAILNPSASKSEMVSRNSEESPQTRI